MMTVAPNAAQAQQGPFVYVPNSGDVPGSVSVIDTPTNTVAPTAIAVGLSPVAAAVRGDESLVYVTNQGGSNTVSVINTATNTVFAIIPAGSGPVGVGFTPDGTRVYVTNINASMRPVCVETSPQRGAARCAYIY
jgi:YVTN family beta-propeller protein